MKSARSFSGYFFLLIYTVAGSVAMLDATVASASPDTDDWRLVSAPPPPGPYHAVNLDPRVPTLAGIDALQNTPRFPQPFGNNMFEIPGPAPAAGGQSNYQAPVNPEPVNQPPPGVPGAYQARTPRSPVDSYPGFAPYPGQMRGEDFRTMPPQGYYSPQLYQDEQSVPPPPVYDSRQQAPPGAYQRGAGAR